MHTSSLPDPHYDAAFYDSVLPKRFFAWVIDAGLVFTAMLIFSAATIGIGLFFWVPIHFTLAFLYRWTTISRGSATFGMRVMSLQLVGRDGRPLCSGQAAAHTLAFLVGATFVWPQLISMGMMAARPMGRGLGDELTGAVMLNRTG